MTSIPNTAIPLIQFSCAYWSVVPFLPVTEAVWLAAVADVVGGPGFVHVAKAALGTWRVERQKTRNIAS